MFFHNNDCVNTNMNQDLILEMSARLDRERYITREIIDQK